MNTVSLRRFCVSPLSERVSDEKMYGPVVQKWFFPNLDLFHGIFLTYIFTLFLDTRITSPVRGVRQNVLLPVLVFGGFFTRFSQTYKNEDSVWDC